MFEAPRFRLEIFNFTKISLVDTCDVGHHAGRRNPGYRLIICSAHTFNQLGFSYDHIYLELYHFYPAMVVLGIGLGH